VQARVARDPGREDEGEHRYEQQHCCDPARRRRAAPCEHRDREQRRIEEERGARQRAEAERDRGQNDPAPVRPHRFAHIDGRRPHPAVLPGVLHQRERSRDQEEREQHLGEDEVVVSEERRVEGRQRRRDQAGALIVETTAQHEHQRHGGDVDQDLEQPHRLVIAHARDAVDRRDHGRIERRPSRRDAAVHRELAVLGQAGRDVDVIVLVVDPGPDPGEPGPDREPDHQCREDRPVERAPGRRHAAGPRASRL
jgi:hypothetical protein